MKKLLLLLFAVLTLTACGDSPIKSYITKTYPTATNIEIMEDSAYNAHFDITRLNRECSEVIEKLVDMSKQERRTAIDSLEVATAVLKAWHGGPPTTKSTSPSFKPDTSSSSVVGIVVISLSITGISVLLRIVATACLFSSTHNFISIPAFSIPKSNPIAPENKEIAFSLLFIIFNLI